MKFLSFDGSGNPVIVEVVENASILSVVLEKDEGFYFKKNNFYITADKADASALKCNRQIASSWEKMFLNYSISGEIDEVGTPHLRAR